MSKISKVLNQYRVSIVVLGTFLIVLMIGIGIYIWQVRKNTPSAEGKKDPLTILQELEKNSQPVTATEEERIKTLESLEKSSKPVDNSVTSEERIKTLEQLQNQSAQ